MKDPEAIGVWMLATRDVNPRIPFHEIADHVLSDPDRIANYPKDYSIVKSTTHEYHSKLMKKAATNDLNACILLLQKGWALPVGVDPEIADRAREMIGTTMEEEA